MHQYEEQEQIAVFRWAKMEEQKYPELKLLYHIPNGGHRNKATAGRLKAAGVKRGVPDICLPVPKGNYAGLYIELKAGKNKTTSDQDYWLEALSKYGYYTTVCYGFEEAVNTITKYINQEVYHEH